jgi:hypothetical protein
MEAVETEGGVTSREWAQVVTILVEARADDSLISAVEQDAQAQKPLPRYCLYCRSYPTARVELSGGKRFHMVPLRNDGRLTPQPCGMDR